MDCGWIISKDVRSILWTLLLNSMNVFFFLFWHYAKAAAAKECK